jgi:hypothetical protein
VSDTHCTSRATDNAAPPARQTLAKRDLTTNVPGQKGETFPRILEITLENTRDLFGSEGPETPHKAPERGDEQARIREMLRDPHRVQSNIIWHYTHISKHKEDEHV